MKILASSKLKNFVGFGPGFESSRIWHEWERDRVWLIKIILSNRWASKLVHFILVCHLLEGLGLTKQLLAIWSVIKMSTDLFSFPNTLYWIRWSEPSWTCSGRRRQPSGRPTSGTSDRTLSSRMTSNDRLVRFGLSGQKNVLVKDSILCKTEDRDFLISNEILFCFEGYIVVEKE